MSAPTTSIVILTRNQLAHTRACVESIARCTPEPYDLVFVDNGSTDGTLEYLRALDGATVIANDDNLGFGGGCNQGIAAARGERVLLLNNDVVVSDGWLGALHAALDEAPDVGIAGPRSNRVAGVQLVADVDYDTQTLEGHDEWAARWVDAHRGLRDDVSRLIGFCMLVRREVLERIGGFDLWYGLGNFEDDDFSLRARIAGYRCRIAHDSWIHHAGSVTFSGERIDYAATMSVNLRRFMQAWRMDERDVDLRTGRYQAERVVRATPFDASRHHAPLIAVADDGAQVELGPHRARVVSVRADRHDTERTAQLLEAALTSVGPDDDVTVAIRIDPRDTRTMPALETIADRIGDSALPDIAIVPARDENDLPTLRVSDATLVARGDWAACSLARAAGCDPVDVDGLRAWIDEPVRARDHAA